MASRRCVGTAAPLTSFEVLKASAVDDHIDFTGKDAHWPDARARKSGLLDRASALAAMQNLPQFLQKLPKAELHVHVEGTLTAERAHDIAVRNRLPNAAAFDPAKAAAARAGYVEGADVQVYCEGENALNAFLTEYNRCSACYRTEQDFYDVMTDYLRRAAADGVVRAEIFFDPQTHCFGDVSGSAVDPAARDPTGVGPAKLPYGTVLSGLWRAAEDGREAFGVESALILSFLQDRSLEEAMAVLDEALKPGNVSKIVGVGQDNGTGPFGPGSTSRFLPAYRRAKEAGLRLVCHAGEEEGAANVAMALDTLQVERVDHGVRSLEDASVVARLARQGTPLTVCPLSNLRMQIQARFFCGACPVRPLLEAGVKVTLNSDDPAYFSLGRVDAASRALDEATYDGFVASNYLYAARDCGLTADECVILARNSLEACFVDGATKARYVERLRAYCDGWRPAARPRDEPFEAI